MSKFKAIPHNSARMYCKKSQQNLGTKFLQSIEDAIVRCCLKIRAKDGMVYALNTMPVNNILDALEQMGVPVQR